MGAVGGPVRVWGTWEELILGGAVLRHGTRDWNVVASELRARSLHPHSFTPEVCRAKFEDLQKRYAGSTAFFEELRKQRMAELKRELARSEDSIGSLESKIKSLETERQSSNQADCDSWQTESPLPVLNSEGNESVCKEALKEDYSSGSFTKDTGTVCGRCQETETDVKPNNLSVSSVEEKDMCGGKVAEVGCGQGVTIRKKRGQRKRKGCHSAFIEASTGESDNVGSSVVASTTQKETSTTACDQTARDASITLKEMSTAACDQTTGDLMTPQKETMTTDCDQAARDSGGNNCNGAASAVNLVDIFQSIASSEPAAVFQHRMDSQKRERYRKVIQQHVDFSTIRSRVAGRSIQTPKELFRDLLLLANNALVFYSRRTHEYKSAFALRILVMKEYKKHYQALHTARTPAFLLPFHPPTRPRSARPRPRPQPCRTRAPGNNPDGHNKTTPGNAARETEAACNSDGNVSIVQMVAKAVKRPEKVKPESCQRKSGGVRARKRVRK